MIATLDLSQSRPVVRVNGDAIDGVVRAEVDVTPDEAPVLILRLVHFKIIGGVLPHGMTHKHEHTHGEGEAA